MGKILLTKDQIILQKLFAIEALAHNAIKHYADGNLDLSEKYIKEMMKIIGEVWLLSKTQEDKGKDWAWWE